MPITKSTGGFFKEGNRDKSKYDEETIKKLTENHFTLTNLPLIENSP
jgi:hypothetical protein